MEMEYFWNMKVILKEKEITIRVKLLRLSRATEHGAYGIG